MPDPVFRFRKLTIILAIAIIVSRSNGFSIHRTTLDDSNLRQSTDTDQAPQESFKAQSLTNHNEIVRDKDDSNVNKNQYKLTSEIGLKDSTDETTLDTIQDTESTLGSSVTGLPSTYQVVKTNENLKVTGLKKESKFNQSIKTAGLANTRTTLSGSTVGLSNNTFLDNITAVLVTTNNSGDYTDQTSPKVESKNNVINITTSTLSNQENEYITTISDGISTIKEITATASVSKLNDQMAIDSESTKKLTSNNQNTTEDIAGSNTTKESKIHSVQTPTIPLIRYDKNEKLSKSTESVLLPTRADSNTSSTTTSLSPLGHDKNKKSNITTETSDTITSRAVLNSFNTSMTPIDKKKNKNYIINTESTVMKVSKSGIDSMKTSTSFGKNNRDDAPTSKEDSNSTRSSTPSSNKQNEKAISTKSTDIMPSKAESNGVLTLITLPDYNKHEKPSIETETTDIELKRVDLTTSESKLETDFANEKENSASAKVEVRVTSTKVPVENSTKPWKKYTTIVRKRITSSEEISPSINNLAKAESIQTTLTIPTTITKEDLESNTNLVIKPKIESVTSELKPTFEPTQSLPSETLETMSSKRAGFLDLSKITTAQSVETSTVREIDFNTLYEMEATDIETQEINKVKGHESRQLAEDAIREELMKEALINNHNVNLKVYEASTGGKKQNEDNQKRLDLTTSQSMTDDQLSVQPINQDKRTTLYTVGPNYKPMKRIDVQQAKPLVRDPDDNSWRNESISSLGIVFKPSNSSTKSYKEVLKTKTETEFNNLQDKEYKDNTPELRERLEKIAEVRKKKKKFDKFGEVVYTDYEEGGSAEGNVTSTPTVIVSSETSSSETSSTLPSLPQEEVTSPMTTTSDITYWNKKLGMFSEDIGLDVLTTQKTKKPYNLAEYYDSTDEYDADYVTLPNIDLKKKFTQPAPRMTIFPHLTSLPMLPTTRIVAPRFPERKPTIQYFPPTNKPQQVNVNDYDVSFEKRVDSFTLKDNTNTNTPFEFERATDRLRADMRPTATPADAGDAPSRPAPAPAPGPGPPHPAHHIVLDDGGYAPGTYVIKHFRDFLSEAAKDDPPPDFEPRTEPPHFTASEFGDAGDGKFDYDYGSHLRKDILSRFVNNFNQNSDRFKVDFPVLFNSSVVHRSNDDEGRVAAQSSTFVKRVYGEPAGAAAGAGGRGGAGCDTVDLSPEYELHYFVPDQEEKEEIESRTAAAHRQL